MTLRAALVLLLSLGPALAQDARWRYFHDGTAHDFDEASSVLCGPDSNVYSCGCECSASTSFDLLVMSHTAGGGERWSYRFDNGVHSTDGARKLIMGRDGRLYGIGWSAGFGTDLDVLLFCLDDQGREQWLTRFDGPAHRIDYVTDVAQGPDGNLYAAGASDTVAYQADMFAISVDTAGTQRWTWRHDGPDHDNERANAVACGPDGNVYVAGNSYDDTYGWAFTVAGLTGTGQQRWVWRRTVPGAMHGDALCLLAGSDGNVYVGGETADSTIHRRFTVVSMSSDGSVRWTWHDSLFYGEATSLIQGPGGHIYAAGRTSDSLQEHPYTTVVSITLSGNLRWVYRCPDAGGYWDNDPHVIAGADSNIYVSGSRHGGGSRYDYDYLVLSLTAAGQQRWVYVYDPPVEDIDYASDVAFGPDSNVYTCGRASTTDSTAHDYTLISLTSAAGVNEAPARAGLRSTLTVAPNPFRSAANAPGHETERFTIFDASGRAVATCFGDRIGAGLPPGVYFLGRSTSRAGPVARLVKL